VTKASSGPGLIATTLIMLVCLAILIGLGVWQLQRKVWKENLIAAMTSRLDAPSPFHAVRRPCAADRCALPSPKN